MEFTIKSGSPEKQRSACVVVGVFDNRKPSLSAELIDRASLAAKPARPLDSERWAGAVDAVGGTTLATILTQLYYRASVAACGLAGGSEVPATVIPFLLRGVNLLGIDSVMCPRDERIEAWQRLARDLALDRLRCGCGDFGLSRVGFLFGIEEAHCRYPFCQIRIFA